MTFLNPLFLLGLLASSVPVLIHLLTRRRPRRVEFSSVEFLREVRLSELKRFRLREWILLALRVLAVACLGLALARPALRGAASGGRGTTTALLLVDRSYSMREREGDRTLFDRARARALEVLDALEAGDRVQVVPFDQTARPVFPAPVEDHGRARAALQSLEPGAAPTDLEAALSTAIEALSRTPSLNRELYVFTDLQRAGLSRESPLRTRPPGLRVVFLPASEAPGPGNLAASEASYRTGEPPAVQVGVRSFGEAAGSRDVPVTLRALVAPGQWREAGRGFLSLTGGDGRGLIISRQRVELGGEVELGGDALSFDDRRAFAAGQSGSVRVALVSGSSGGAPSLGSGRSPLDLVLEAGQQAGRFSLTRLEPARLGPGALTGLDVVLLDDVSALGDAGLQAVIDFARGGGGVVVVLGPHVDARFWNARVLPALGGVRLTSTAPVRTQGGGWALRRVAVGHAALAGFPEGAGDALSQAQFHAAWPLDPGPQGRVLARFAPNLPALVEDHRLLVFTSDAASAWSDFPFSGAFLPFWHQSLLALAQGNGPTLSPGQRLDLPVPSGESQAVWTLRAPSGRDIPLETRLAEGSTRLLSPPLEEAGLYVLAASGRPVRGIPVNLDLVESDLARLGWPEARARWRSLGAQIVAPREGAHRVVREGRYGRELWREFLALALLLLVAETILARLWGGRAAAASASEPGVAPAARRAAG